MAVNESMIAEEVARGISEGFSQGAFPGAALVIFPIIIIILIMSLLIFVGWIWMIIDCAKRNRFRSGDRVVWILLLVLLGPIGMVLYYFMVMR
jgi:hypothetical protein